MCVSVCMWFCGGAFLSIVCKLFLRNSSILFSVHFNFIVVSLRAVKVSNLCLSGKYLYDFFFFSLFIQLGFAVLIRLFIIGPLRPFVTPLFGKGHQLDI